MFHHISHAHFDAYCMHDGNNVRIVKYPSASRGHVWKDIRCLHVVEFSNCFVEPMEFEIVIVRIIVRVPERGATIISVTIDGCHSRQSTP